LAALAVHMTTNASHATRPTPKTPVDTGEAFGERVDQKGANHVNNNCDEAFESEHASMMSLPSQDVKTGKRG